MQRPDEYGRVVQVGTQQRSGEQFRRACEWVRNGYIGQLVPVLVEIRVVIPVPRCAICRCLQDVDYDLWLGPCPLETLHARTTPKLAGLDAYFTTTRWGSSPVGQHDIDIAQWGNGTDHTGPVRKRSRVVPPSLPTG